MSREVGHELRELYYYVVVFPDLESTGQVKRAYPATFDTTSSSVCKADLRIPKISSPLMTYEEQLIATGEAPVDSFRPMISLGNKKELDLNRETHVLVDCHMSIRILHMRPGNSLLDDVECELQVVTLRDGPVYEALSYTWGDESHRRYISSTISVFPSPVLYGLLYATCATRRRLDVSGWTQFALIREMLQRRTSWSRKCMSSTITRNESLLG